MTNFDVPAELKEEISQKFHIPKPEKLKGRLNWMQKDNLVRQEGLMNPLHCFHAEYKMRKKGRDGSPTCDAAGFVLDRKRRVDGDKRNARATKSSMVNDMERHLERVAREEKETFKIFFKGEAPRDADMDVKDYIQDHVSKDLGLAWHQIGPGELKQWEARGFEKQGFETWWREPNAEEKKRISKMQRGCIFRKDL